MQQFYTGLVAALGIAVLSISSPCQAERPEALERDVLPASSTKTVAPDPKGDVIYLLDQANKSLIEVDKIQLPQRVYLKKTRMDGVYQHFLSGKGGNLGNLRQILLSSSIVRGDRIGGSRERYYFLNREGNWRRTEGPEVYYVQDDSPDRTEYVQTPGDDAKTSPHVAQGKALTHFPD